MDNSSLHPLLLAAKNGNVAQLKQLLTADSNLIDQRDKVGIEICTQLFIYHINKV